jgi:hypothetical protein
VLFDSETRVPLAKRMHFAVWLRCKNHFATDAEMRRGIWHRATARLNQTEIITNNFHAVTGKSAI